MSSTDEPLLGAPAPRPLSMKWPLAPDSPVMGKRGAPDGVEAGLPTDAASAGLLAGQQGQPADRPKTAESPRRERIRLVATILKAFIGSGVLFLPKAFAEGGWLFSVVVMLFMVVVSQYTIMRLVRCREVVDGTFGYIGEVAMGGRAGRWMVDAALVLSQAGFCCVYVSFIARNVLQLLSPSDCLLWAVVLLQLPIFAPLTWIRRMAYFGPLTLAADGLIFAGLIGILGWAFHGIATTSTPLVLPAFEPSSFPLFLGTAIYAYEGVGMVLPIYASLSPVGQKSFPRVLTYTLLAIASVYIIIGLVPYIYVDGMGGAPKLQDAITLNLPAVWWARAIQVGYCVALVFTYPLMLFPALRVIEGALTPGLLRPGGVTKWRRNAVRTGVVAATLLVSYLAADQLNNLVALVGCFACTPLAFIFPCLFHLRLVKGAPLWTRVADVAIIIFGLGVFGFSTYQAITTWSTSSVCP